MPLTDYAQRLIARAYKPPARFWSRIQDGKELRLEIISRNAYDWCLMRYPDGMLRQMRFVDLKRNFRPYA